MKWKKISAVALVCTGLMGFTAAFANEVLLVTNQPLKLTFKVAHKNVGGTPVFGDLQSVNLDKNIRVPVNLDGYDLTGLVVVSANGHELPPTVNEFDKAEQCSMTTNKVKSTGALEFSIDAHTFSCRTYGGVYG